MSRHGRKSANPTILFHPASRGAHGSSPAQRRAHRQESPRDSAREVTPRRRCHSSPFPRGLRAVRTAGDVPLLPAALEPQAGVRPRREVPRQKPDKSRALPRTPRSAGPGRGSAARGVWLSHGPLGVVVHSFGPALSELHSPPASAVRLWPLPAPATGNPAAPRSEALGRFPPSPLRSGG